MVFSSKRAGFTLVEVIVAVTVFVIGIMAVVTTVSALVRFAGETWRLSQAVIRADSELEAVRATCGAVGESIRRPVAVINVRRARLDPLQDTIGTVIRCSR